MENTIVGKYIKNIKIADDKLALLFQCDDGDIVLRVDGDCCSNSWIESITLPESFPALVTDIINGDDRPDDKNPDDEFDVVAYYMTNLITDKGIISIDYRNASNGY